MTPNQLEVLRLAHELGEIDRFKVSCKMGISTDYADYLCRWPSREGYPSPVAGRNTCCLTARGNEALVSELYQVAGLWTSGWSGCLAGEE